MNSKLWQAKLAAWTHDPAEKALVLLRDPAGHESGTVRALREKLFPAGVPDDIERCVRRADHWAAAADRPQFGGGGRDAWARVNFAESPILIHPLSGEGFDLGKLSEIDPAHIQALSETHFEELIIADDVRKTALMFWRFGPTLDRSTLPLLWQLLPADTRQPDHTIWAHLDLASAFASASIADEHGDVALLAMSFGPVQDFIAAAKSTSDLWAGSHLLSRIAWEGLKVIAETCGPDAVLFPQLRGVPQVDLWLRFDVGLPAERFADAEWLTEKTDANPLFIAAMPNKFVALVPAGQAQALAERASQVVREWVRNEAQAILAEVLEKAGFGADTGLPCHAQLAEQLADFPEVHWAAVPFSLIALDGEGKALPEQLRLAESSRIFYGNVEKPGFLGSPAWALLTRELAVEGIMLFKPNPGMLYPAIYELLDRVAAAAKSARPFSPLISEGFRCDLTGEAEWLTTDREQLLRPRGQRLDTLWARIAQEFPGLLKKGEHLSALAMLKRFWPRRFAQTLAGLGIDVQRYVVSTHTLALAGALERWIERDAGRADLLPEAKTPVALPRRLMRKLIGKSTETRRLARTLPAWLDAAENEERVARLLSSKEFLGAKPDTYYALVMMDGDRMGAWLAGSEDDYLVRYGDTFHPAIRAVAREKLPSEYFAARRPVSPARHMAISAALNDFALHLARHVVEDLCKGKLIYAGGDDVLAMVSVDDLLRCLLLLRLSYSGIWPERDEALVALCGLAGERQRARLSRGFARHEGRLLRLMGERATASIGAVIAHHQAPLSSVLRELRATEKRAKQQGGRDAFSINLMKRAGGAVHLTLPWLAPGQNWKDALTGDLLDSPAALLLRLMQGFAGKASRRAAYLTQGWLADLPAWKDIGSEAWQALVTTNLGYQLKRQGFADDGDVLARHLAHLAAHMPERAGETVENLLAVAEFLAREGRAGNKETV
ncbi:MAG: type III-B CRISPR-associated protein Cas10/Cmr2 [Pseudomonadota bacterium]